MMKKEEEDRLRREIEEKKQREMEEKRRRLAERGGGWGARVNPTDCIQCTQAGTNSCSPSTNCIGSGCPVTCNCRTGWQGARCADDVNECLAGSNRPCVSANTINCYNLYGDYSCICREGFNGKNCQNQVSGNLNSVAGWLLSFLK